MKKTLLVLFFFTTWTFIYGQEYCDNFKVVSIFDIPPAPQTPGGNYFLLLLTLEEDNLDNLDNYANLFFVHNSGDTISIPTGNNSTLPLYATDTIPYVLQLNTTSSNQDFPEDFTGKLVIIHSIQPVCEVNYSNVITSANTHIEIDEVKTYPIPFDDKLKIESSKNIERISIINNNGNNVGQYFPNLSYCEMNLERLSMGNYFMILQLSNGKTIVKKIMKN